MNDQTVYFYYNYLMIAHLQIEQCFKRLEDSHLEKLLILEHFYAKFMEFKEVFK